MADFHVGEQRCDEVERAAVARALGDEGFVDPAIVFDSERLVRGGARRTSERRQYLLPALHALQASKGWISPGGINHLAELLSVAPAEAYGVATFYDMFVTEEPLTAGPIVHACGDPVCLLANDGTDLSQDKGVHESSCLGQCERAPARFIQGVGAPDTVETSTVETSTLENRLAQFGEPGLKLLKRIGQHDPTQLASYRSVGGYEALTKAIEMGSEAVIDAIEQSGLTGRGGAGFPTGVKWRAVFDQTGRPKHVVANADESEPGTFKDRVVMESDPFALIEALTIAGLTTGAENGWIYIRGEYPLATSRLREAARQARSAGLLGDDIAGSGRRFDITIRRGAGAYICGEETALFNSVEGYRGEPRDKPPFPTTHGLFNEPTAINNPETLLNVLEIVLNGVTDFRSVGTTQSPGTKLFCLSGRIARPGLYEVPFAMSLADLLALAGGVVNRAGEPGDLRCILLGGAAGSFVSADALDMQLDMETTRAAGLSLGSGVVMVFDSGVSMEPIVERLARFFRDESCGQCVPCRVGTARQHELVVQIGSGSASTSERGLLGDVAMVMADASICGLGHSASTAVKSAFDLGLIGSRP
jgi:NADH-quinone oxidoreductase subunit F